MKYDESNLKLVRLKKEKRNLNTCIGVKHYSIKTLMAC